MSVLDSLIKFRELEDQKRGADIAAIPKAIDSFMAQRRQSKLDELTARKTDADIANIESQIESRAKGSLIDQIKEANELFTVAKNTQNAPLGVAAKKRIDNLLGVSGQPLLDESGRVPAQPIEAPTERIKVQPTVTPEVTTKAPQAGAEGVQAVPKDIFGNVTPEGEAIKAQNELFIKQKSSDIEVQKQTRGQMAKDQLKTGQNLLAAGLQLGSSLDSFLDTAARTKELTGLPPGPIGGLFTTVLGKTKANEFVDGFNGSLIEVAAAVGAAAIPGARAVRLVNLFKKTGISVWQNMESAVQTTADSFRNALSKDMSRNVDKYIPNAKDLTFEEINTQLSEKLRIFEAEYRRNAIQAIYKRDPELLKEETQTRVEAQLPVFDTPEAGDEALDSGTLFRLPDGRIAEAE